MLPRGAALAQRDIVVIGGSAGSIGALQRLVRGLPKDFAGAILAVVHLSPQSGGLLPDILSRAGALPAGHARQNETIRRGNIYIAPPDRHLLISQSGKMRL